MQDINETFSTIINLEYPIKINGMESSVISIRRPKVKDFMIWAKEKDEGKKDVIMISHLANLTPEEVAELDLKDFKKISEVVASFLSE